jgi:hypothetical protein
MEASMAGQGQGDAGDGYGGQAQGFDGAGLDASALADQFGQLTEGQEEMRQVLAGLQEHLTQPQQEVEQGPPPLDLNAAGLEQAGGDPGEGFDDAAAAQELAGHVTAAMHAHTAPLREQVSDLQRTIDIKDLVAELPELGEPETMRVVLDNARVIVESEGLPREMGARPGFVRLVYLAGRAMEIAQTEEAAGEQPQAAHLEGGGGAGPGGGRGVGPAHSIVDAGRHNPLPFQ